MDKTEAWLVRHGHTHRTQHHPSNDPPLSQLGKRQAAVFSEHIDFLFDLVVVSSLRRSAETAQPLLKKYPNLSCQTWPIDEFCYLNENVGLPLSIEERQTRIQRFWEIADPHYKDSASTESFSDFIKRLIYFNTLLKAHKGRLVVFGHGLFLKAYLMWLDGMIEPSSESMQVFRKTETEYPISNTECIVVDLK